MRPLLILAAAAGLLPPPPEGASPIRDRGPVDRVPPALWREGDPAHGRAGPAAPPEGEPLAPDDWRFWWAWNRDAVLDSRLPREEQAYCVPAGDLTLPSEREWGPEAPWRGDWDRFVLPVLLRLARGEDEPRAVREQALRALGRAREALPLLREMASGHAREPGFRGTALLALGLTGYPRDSDSRLLVHAYDEGEPPALRVVALAAAAILPPGSVPPGLPLGVLEGALDRGDRELAVAALVALRAHPSPDALPRLLDLAESGEADGRPLGDLVRAHAVHAASGVPLRARDRDADLARRRSRALHGLLLGAGRLTGIAAVRGLGECVVRDDDPDRASAVEALALVALGRPGDDGETRRGLALVALARSLARERGDGGRARAVVESALAEGGPAAGWAAIAMGTARDRRPPAGDAAAAGWRRALGRRLADRSGMDGERAAAALALGLLGDEATAAPLRRVLGARDEGSEVRAAAAQALGLLPGEAARDAIRAAFGDPGCDPFRGPLSLSAGLHRDASLAGRLAALLESPGTDSATRAAAARALGWIGATGVRDRLLTIARDPLRVRGAEIRAAAVAALGGYAGRGGPGESAPRRDRIGRLAADFPHRAWTPGMGAVLDGF